MTTDIDADMAGFARRLAEARAAADRDGLDPIARVLTGSGHADRVEGDADDGILAVLGKGAVETALVVQDGPPGSAGWIHAAAFATTVDSLASPGDARALLILPPGAEPARVASRLGQVRLVLHAPVPHAAVACEDRSSDAPWLAPWVRNPTARLASLTVDGVQGHIAYPEDTVNPIHVFARLAVALDRLAVTFVGSAAGTGATNVVPGRLRAVIAVPDSAAADRDGFEDALRQLAASHAASITVDWPEADRTPIDALGGVGASLTGKAHARAMACTPAHLPAGCLGHDHERVIAARYRTVLSRLGREKPSQHGPA